MTLSKISLWLLFMITIPFSCISQDHLNDVNFLLGTWKMEGQNTYESWDKISNTEYRGISYKIHEGERKISETLLIKYDAGKIIYEATVPNQNDGKTISFPLNKMNKELVSFENMSHDFPKKIQYKSIDDSKILVNVLGEEDKGFSYYLLKQ